MKIFNLPDLGEGLPDAEINHWHVQSGDVIEVDQPLVSMETAKAVVEVPSPYKGKISKLYGKPGDIIKTGSPLVEFTEVDAPVENTANPSSTVVGSIPVSDTVIEESAIGITPSKKSETTLKVIPAVRALAKNLQVDLTQVTPTGANGQITLDDVKNASQNMSPSSSLFSIEPLRSTRRAMANVMSQSHREIAPVTLMDDADIHSWPQETDITYRIIRALIAGCAAEPTLNSHFDYQKLERKIFTEVNLGIAMDSPEGLFVPVIKSAHTKNQTGLRELINQYKQQVNTRSIAPENLQGCTIQLSNFGTFAGRYATPVIVPPIVAILGTGKIREAVVAYNGEIAIRRVVPLSLTIDHRAVTGGEAARFLAAVISDLQRSE